jgi:predicted ATPase
MHRVGFVGCAGTGKSTLAKATAEILDVPFLSSKAITQPILERDEYDYGSGIQIERFLAHNSRQLEIMRKTIKKHKKHEQFVADRTVVDLAAYAVKELHEHDIKTLSKIYDACRDAAGMYTHLIVCPWRQGPVADNKRRTLNQWYQFLIHCTERGIIREWGLKEQTQVFVLESDGFDARMAEVESILSE